MERDILQALCDVWERVKEAIKKFAERIREIFEKLPKVVEPGRPIKVTDYRCYRDFYVRAEYTYHRRNF